jgi:uncharacterized protein
MEQNEQQPASNPPVVPVPTAAPVPADAAKQSNTWGMLCHLAALSGFIGIPLGFIIGPLVIWLIKKDEIPFVNEQGKNALNFQISMAIYAIVSGLLMIIAIGVFLLIAVGVTDLILVIIASIKASKGESYKYPLTITFIK